jgi:phage N-6-adenine-methyltransferase
MNHLVKSNLDELLSDCGVIDAVSWQPPANMTYEQWADIGGKFQYIDSARNWWLGDWLNEGEKRYGEKYAQAVEVTGHKLDHLQACGWVAANVTCTTRVVHLSWTHHRYVAKLDESAQRSLLTFAAEHNLSSRDLLESVREYDANLKQFQPVEESPDQEPPFAKTQGNPLYSDTSDYEEMSEELAEDEDGYDWDNDSAEPAGHDDPPPSRPHVSHNSGNNEWYTPEEYIQAARSVLGRIDLDPATSEIANKVVQADEFYTVQDDGLAQHWTGKVWMNPPYASDLVGKFAEKLIEHYHLNDVTEAIVLVNNATETGWFQRMAQYATCVCFPRTRVKFWKPDGETGAPLQGQAILYFGTKKNTFTSAFRPFGFVGVINE